ncbi:hypothetical protein predicted by Glimmer/Critica [Sorangium cellulosum So ce56]|uniref:Uncharacterized protein n=1 Tax=Sorangium cellulosum (strain So ce56) TaxID=448385 RepID=A9GDG7_SORC5|nr:hypothetical protein predicted by Glimmer/Critica [Sorangium cellulosum So ce56]
MDQIRSNWKCAQRLPASRRGSLKRPQRRPIALGAQRLPASRRGSHAYNTTGNRSRPVLNAFRHHGGDRSISMKESKRIRGCAQRLPASRRGSQPAALEVTEHGFEVLNAFRHHGGDRDLSTQLAQRLSLVLNAFRHHGGDRPLNRLISVVSALCSTPSGITAGIARASSPRTREASCAQRLPASRRGSLATRGGGLTLGKCSTPSGITAGIAADALDRLTALATCSTPSGITAGIAARVEPCLRELHVLNAFRHHGGDRKHGPPERLGVA